MKKGFSISAVAACAFLLAGCGIFSGGEDTQEDFSSYEGTWGFSWEQNGKKLALPVGHPPKVKLCAEGKLEATIREDGRIKTVRGSWRINGRELILITADGKGSTRFRIVSENEVRSTIPPTEHIKPNTVMVLKKETLF